jgi:hypothetical protein
MDPTKKYEKYKATYLNAKTKMFYRATTLLFEKDKQKTTVILLQDKDWLTYNDIGGSIENETIINTAMRELREESRNTLDFSEKIYENAPFFDVYNNRKNGWCRVFVICVNKNIIDEEIYYKNMKIIDKSDLEPMWKETIGMTRFYVSDINNCDSKTSEDIKCIDIKGNNQKICLWTYNQIKKAIILLDSCSCIHLKLVKSVQIPKTRTYISSV